MRGEHGSQNKILPVKSLFENARQLGKKQYIQFGSRDTPPLAHDPAHTPRTLPASSHQERPPHSHRDHPAAFIQVPPRQHFKGISLGKNQQMGKPVPPQFPKQSSQPPLAQFQEFLPAKRERSGYSEYESAFKSMSFFPERTGNESVKVTRRAEAGQECGNMRTVATEKKESAKSGNLNRVSEELESKSTKLNEKYSCKMEDETWNVSTFERTTFQDREGRSQQADELARLKIELLQRDAQLADKSQQLDQREAQARELAVQVRELTVRLELTVDLNANLKNKINEIKRKGEEIRSILSEKEAENKLYEEKSRQMEDTLKSKEEELNKLRNAIARCRDESKLAEEDLQAHHKLALLKIRQLEFEDREKTQTILELREKDKRSAQNYEKIINGINELLRQKEEHLIQISETAVMYKEEASRISEQLESEKIRHAHDLNAKETIIRELSGEIGDLKKSLNAYEARVREMIEAEDELRKELDNRIIEDAAHQNQLRSHQAAIAALSQQNATQLMAYEAELSQSSQQMDLLQSKVAELEATVIESRTSQSMLKVQSDNFQRELTVQQERMKQVEQENTQLLLQIQCGLEELQHKQTFFQLAQDKIHELQRSATEREKQLATYITKIQELQQANRIGSMTRMDSPTKSSRGEDKEVGRLKSANLKLLKDNERLSLIVKDMDAKLYQFYKVNKGLNDEIMGKELEALNLKIMQKYAACQL